MITFAPLWRTGVTTYTLQKAGISGSVLTRLRNDQPVSTRTIDALCTLLECQPSDVMQHINDRPVERERSLHMKTAYDQMIQKMAESASSAERDLAAKASTSAYKIASTARIVADTPQAIADGVAEATGMQAMEWLGVDDPEDLEGAILENIKGGWLSVHMPDQAADEKPILAVWEDSI